MAGLGARGALLTAVAVVLPAVLAGCTAGPADGVGDRVLIVKNLTNITATVDLRVFHSSTNPLPGDNDPAIKGEIKLEGQGQGAFFFELPNGTAAMSVDILGYRRLFGQAHLAQCDVFLFEVGASTTRFVDCAPPFQLDG